MSEQPFSLVNLYAYARHPNQIRRFVRRMSRFPDVAFPRTVYEKFLWRKLFDHNPLFEEISDKLRAKEYAARRCPELRVPRVLWEGETAKEIPEKLMCGIHVLKANHGCRFNLFLPADNADNARRTAQIWLKNPYGRWNGEWAYWGIRRKLFIEERVGSLSGQPLTEYKIHTCGGKAVWIFHIAGRLSGRPTASLFRPDGSRLSDSGMQDFAEGSGNTPENLAKAIEFAERLGAEFDYMRCDILDDGETLHFNEMTVYPQSGNPWNRNAEILEAWNANWDLLRSWFLTAPQSGWLAHYSEALRDRLDRKPA